MTSRNLSLTISAGLYGSLDISDTLHGDSILVVSVDVLIFEFTNLVQQDAKLVGNVGNVFVAMFTPERQLLLLAY